MGDCASAKIPNTANRGAVIRSSYLLSIDRPSSSVITLKPFGSYDLARSPITLLLQVVCINDPPRLLNCKSLKGLVGQF